MAESPTAPSKQTPPTVHEDYQKGDVHLLSSDNVLFCVDGYRLGKASKVFSDMLSVPRPITSSTSDADAKVDTGIENSSTRAPSTGAPIEMEETSATLQCFLELAALSGNRTFPLSVDETGNLFLFHRKWDLNDKLSRKIVDEFYRVAIYHDPWGWFHLASQWGDVEFAARALHAMGDGKTFLEGRKDVGFWRSLRELGGSWDIIVLEEAFGNPGRYEFVNYRWVSRKKYHYEQTSIFDGLPLNAPWEEVCEVLKERFKAAGGTEEGSVASLEEEEAGQVHM
ncbi:hypothetical protein L198_00213 [Cryptococcus wingfieldii CBS 7118]|uniref:BTB domain-containing protein n=1 Tax=Cryptococcus wingfieldii CBS 7118 TaxID=1295528 RepID=A0A1E3K6J4_9TREE|nr:hypothetical protein L198_00213 [Cryptococcus wingfieldii CBS 7118]ODO08483.1 hypothetical protein L198_00213 [Cryptococcus wingfieldii CBS 7118]